MRPRKKLIVETSEVITVSEDESFATHMGEQFSKEEAGGEEEDIVHFWGFGAERWDHRKEQWSNRNGNQKLYKSAN